MTHDSDPPPSIFDHVPMPPIARLLGWKLIAVDPGSGTIDVQFTAGPEFTNPSGRIQGGVIAAMLDDTLGPAAFAMSGGKRMPATVDLHVQYLRPVAPGRIIAKACVIKLGSNIAFLRGELFDAGGGLSAVATASALLSDYSGG